MLTILRSLALLESKFAKVCEQSTAYLTLTSESAQVTKPEIPKDRPFETLTLKRKIGYNETADCIETRVNKRDKMMVDHNADSEQART